MRLRSTDFDRHVTVGASVVEREAEWRPDPGVKPWRISLQFAFPDVAATAVSTSKVRGGVIVAAVGAFFAFWVALPL